MKTTLFRMLKLVFWIVGGVTVVPMSLYILFGSVNTGDVIISPAIIHLLSILWVTSITRHFFFAIKNTKKDLHVFKYKQAIRAEKQEEHLTSQKVPSKLARIIAVSSLISLGTYISYILFYTENISVRMETFSWIALVVLIIFFIKLLTTPASERDKFWKIFFSGIGFVSDKERREVNKNMLILFVLVIIGILAIFFL